jgi:hypothetical protein
MSRACPQMSVVLVTDAYETIRAVARRLSRQTVCDELELVLVVPATSPESFDEPDLAGFHAVRVVRVDSLCPLARARAVGVRAASAPVVQIGETHAYPDAGWAEALIQSHSEGWSAVAPAMSNANPDGPISWANLILDYGSWLDALPGGEIESTPTYNTAYKRSLLLQLGPQLEAALSGGNDLSLALRSGGHRSCLAAAARLAHANVSRPGAWLHQRFIIGLVRASERRRGWPRARRLIYVLASPIIPGLLLARTARTVRALRDRHLLPPLTLPAMVIGAALMGAGEMVGYAGGGGVAAANRLDEYELHKVRYIRRGGTTKVPGMLSRDLERVP